MLAVAVSPFLTASFVWWVYMRFFEHLCPIPNEKGKFKQHSILRRLFIDFPKQLVYDFLTIDPNTFREYGMHLLCGEQGSGKTTLMAYLVRKYKHEYPRVIVRSNFSCSMQDYELTDWRDLTLDTNGIYGEIDCIDEIQNWFSSNQSKSFPPDMLTIITQQRKVRRCILATSQIFTRVAKPIRENTYLMYYPFTIAGCLTFVRVYKPILDEQGALKERKLRKVFFFVHDKELREMFDSYKTICSLRESGFKENNSLLSGSPSVIVQATAYPKR
ncbi:MAG: ATP-binding protein [Ruminococcus sp.]|nr:ATP-binding protein [Ruminococcus sp.]